MDKYAGHICQDCKFRWLWQRGQRKSWCEKFRNKLMPIIKYCPYHTVDLVNANQEKRDANEKSKQVKKV